MKNSRSGWKFNDIAADFTKETGIGWMHLETEASLANELPQHSQGISRRDLLPVGIQPYVGGGGDS